MAELLDCKAPKSSLNCVSMLLLFGPRKGQQIYTEQVKDQPTEVKVGKYSVDQEAVARENWGHRFRKGPLCESRQHSVRTRTGHRRQGKRNGGCVVELSPYFHGFMRMVRQKYYCVSRRCSLDMVEDAEQAATGTWGSVTREEKHGCVADSATPL